MLNTRPEEDGDVQQQQQQQQAQSFQERMMLYAKPIQPKPVKSRSRAGCKYCRDKRKKCSEDKPRCARCIQFGVECVYEPIKKRKKRTTKFTVPSPPDDTLATSPETGPGATQAFHYGQPTTDSHLDGSAAQMDSWASMGADASMSDSTVTTSPSLLGFDDGLIGDNTYQLVPTPFDLSGPVCGTQAEVIPSLAWSPGIDEDLLPWPYLSGSVMWDESMAAPQFLGPNPAEPASQLDLNVMGWMTAPSPLSGGIMQAFGGHIQQQQPPSPPRPQSLDQDVLLDHFRNSIVLSQSVGAGDPIVRLITPLSYSSSVVRQAALALAGAHLTRAGTHGDIDHATFYDQALGSILTQAPLQDVRGLEQTLAALLLLLHYEVTVQRGHANLVTQHLGQAWQLLQLPLASDLTSLSMFEQAFGYFDSLHALSSNIPPVSPPSLASDTPPANSPMGLASSLLPTIHRLAELSHIPPSPRTPAHAEHDAARGAVEQSLMAWEPPLPPGYTLVNRVVDGPEDAPEMEVAAVRSAASRGLALKQAALTFLHRCVGGHAPGSEPVQRHARAALWHCVAAASSPYAAAVANGASTGERSSAGDLRSGTGAGLLWPLFVASLEASEGRDRGMARQAFAALEGLKGVVNSGKAWEVVLEVWRRKDLAKAGGGPDIGGMGWTRVAEEMGLSIVFG
ncbi:fungal-specific transcription factor domain-containing protein [Plectosphaerella plurivora]|uniref:Fungal-specific transcription factor domain-containing protein n=1 Tax=Plectosphaerella plurivora TaxID=936078 RepID=A0A9P9A948_9PEZI|nr:fungal-specific transcription factor domain-containing protein [Plectosphaerella plurivora]